MLQLVSKKIIKPSFVTSPPLKCYKLSLNDQASTHNYGPMALFYANQCRHHPCNTSQISQLLEGSLSKLLASYYPLTGRLIDNVVVDIGAAGATFSEVRIKSSMVEILIDSDTRAQDIVFPSGLPWSNSYEGSLLHAQLSHFDCGGLALSVCMSHKIGDGVTLCNFFSDWAAMACQSGEKPSLEFPGASMFPPLDDQPTIPANDSKEKCITKRFVFDVSNLDQLRAMVGAESGVHNPTRVEVVTALLYKSALLAASKVRKQSLRPSVLQQLANLRSLVVPPLPQNSVGNIFAHFSVSTADEGELNLSRLVRQLRKGKEQFCNKYGKSIGDDDHAFLISTRQQDIAAAIALVGQNNVDVYCCSSLCRQPLYHIDFGWGRPIRVGLAAKREKNHFILIDDHTGNGIEALVTLTEKDMLVFESDKELLAFASLNPLI